MEETMLVGDPLVDRKVESSVQTFSAWRARMKKEHFTSYLLTYTALLGAATGGVYGFLAFRFGDAMAPYLRIRKRTVLLSVAVGFGLGVFVAVTQVPPDIKGKVSMLLLTIAVGVAITTLSALALFVIQRWRSIAHARQAGRPLTTRLRAP